LVLARTVFNVIARPAEEGGYWAEVVELPGCVSQGETKDELLHNIREAIQACLEAYGDDEPSEPYAELWGIPVLGDFRKPDPDKVLV
jgi:predicted RNase H-like HicB family nuclease